MMKVLSLGVGEAMDEDYPTNSHLVMCSGGNILLDCGDSAVRQFWKLGKPSNFLDAVYISHHHFDHFNGLPALLVRMAREGREKPVSIICQKETEDFLTHQLFANLRRFTFVVGIDKESGPVEVGNGLTLTFAPTFHTAPNLAISVNDGANVVCYNGDGRFLQETKTLYQNADLLIAETYSYEYDEKKPGHGCIRDTICMAEELGIPRLMLTHLHKDFRKNHLPNIRHQIKSDKVKIIIPEPLHEEVL